MSIHGVNGLLSRLKAKKDANKANNANVLCLHQIYRPTGCRIAA